MSLIPIGQQPYFEAPQSAPEEVKFLTIAKINRIKNIKLHDPIQKIQAAWKVL